MATTQPVVTQPRPQVRQINYLAKTFTDFRQNFIEFAKAYYPNTYADFNEASPGMMFIEMASYLGDVLSFYIDNSFKENLLAYAEQPENIISISQFLGYKPKLIQPATAEVELSILVPAKLVNNVYEPDSKYLINYGVGTVFTTNDERAVQFRLTQNVDFRDITSENYLVSSYSAGNPSQFVITKTATVVAGTARSVTVGFGTAQRFVTALLPDEPIIGIESVFDSNGNQWYEVDYLAQDLIMDDVQLANNGETGQMPNFGLRLKKVPRRFVTRYTRDLRLQMVFGSGVTNDSDVDVIVDSRQVATSQYGNTILNEVGNTAINNLNFLNSTAYGLAPSNTTLTVNYLVGGGVNSNTPSNTIVTVQNAIVLNDTAAYTPLELATFQVTTQTLRVNNPAPATGGGAGDSLDEIKENALAFFNAQNRVVTTEDYVVRSYALPAKYGKVSKAFAIRDEQLNAIMTVQDEKFVSNNVRPTSINLYTLGQDKNGKLTTLNTKTKENLARYLEQYRMITDDINILDAFIINIGVNFNITTFRNYNMNDVMARCIGVIQDYFNIDKWSINQPIILADLIYNIGSVEGVQTVNGVTIFNKYLFKDGLDYQNYRYDISEATVNGVIYPSLDPSIFELKYPQTDIIGSATQ